MSCRVIPHDLRQGAKWLLWLRSVELSMARRGTVFTLLASAGKYMN